jgi:hypothetical protein
MEPEEYNMWDKIQGLFTLRNFFYFHFFYFTFKMFLVFPAQKAGN